MKKMLALNISAILIFGLSSCNAEKKFDKNALKTQEDKVSYAIGLDLGKNAKKESIAINPDIFKEGFKHGLDGAEPFLNDKEITDVMTAFKKEISEKQEAKKKEIGDKNLKDGEAFLAKKKTEKDVVTLPSGLMYKILKPGKGKSPKLTDNVTVHYKGTLIDGKEFDSSYKRNEPANFVLNGVIPGWKEGLQLMKEGGKLELYIPSKLAYGEGGAGQDIAPNSALVFEVELIKVN